jgi:hypothetical protein
MVSDKKKLVRSTGRVTGVARGPGLTVTDSIMAAAQSLELRLRWLEALIYGVSLAHKLQLKRGETLVRAAQHTQKRLNDIASSHDVLQKFISHRKSRPPSLFLLVLTTTQMNSMHNT